eukprot:95079_1
MAEGLAGAMRKSGAAFKGGLRSPAMILYRNICKEIPHILTIYDMDLKIPEVRKCIGNIFRQNQHIEDPNVIRILVSKGYMELEETVLQYKQPTHIMRLLDPHNQVYRVSHLPVHPKTREDREEYFCRGLDVPTLDAI